MSEMSTEILMLLWDVSWRITVFAVVVAVVVRLVRLSDPTLLHTAWHGVLLGMLALPALVLWAPALTVSPPAALNAVPVALETVALETVALETVVPVAEALKLEAPLRLPLAQPSIAPTNGALASAPAPVALDAGAWNGSRAGAGSTWPALLALIYGLGVVVMAARLMGAWWLTRRLVAGGEPIPLSDCPEGPRGACLKLHGEVRVPLSTGWLRPTVLLPLAWLGWDDATRRYAITHELVHIRRGDYAVQLMAAVNRCLFWFHPLAWMLPERLAALAEQACDQGVVERCGDRPRYARVLLEVAACVAAEASQRRAWIGASMAGGGNLSPRIEAVLATPRGRRVSPRAAAWSLASLMVVGITGAASLRVGAAPESPPAPAVASVDPVVAPAPPAAPKVVADVASPARPVIALAPAAPVASVAPVSEIAGAPRAVIASVSPPSAVAPAIAPVVAASTELGSVAGGSEPVIAAGSIANDCAGESHNFILWFDDQGRKVIRGEPLTATPKRWITDAARWIREDLCPADRVAIVSFKGRLRIDQDFTLDRDAAVAALEQVTRWKPSRTAPVPAADQPSLLRALPPKREFKRRSHEVGSAVRLLAEAAATVEGRKDLIVLTRGFRGWNRVFTGSGGAGPGRTIFKAQAEQMRAGGVVVHAIQTGPGSFYSWGGVTALTSRTGGWIYGVEVDKFSRSPSYTSSRTQGHNLRASKSRSYNILDGLRAIARAIELQPDPA